MTAVLYYRWLAAGLHNKIISQGVGGHRVCVGIRHPNKLNGYLYTTANNNNNNNDDDDDDDNDDDDDDDDDGDDNDDDDDD